MRTSHPDNIQQGPARWERARKNAEENPTSAGAKKYNKRMDMANRLAFDMQPHSLVPLTLEHIHSRPGPNPDETVDTVQSREHLCSVKCAALRLQLYFSDKKTQYELEQLLSQAIKGQPAALVLGRWWGADRLRRITTVNEVMCRVCGDRINKRPDPIQELNQHRDDFVDAVMAAQGTPADPPTELCYINKHGEIMRGEDFFKPVRLTEHQYEVLSKYSTPELRWKYACDNEVGG